MWSWGKSLYFSDYGLSYYFEDCKYNYYRKQEKPIGEVPSGRSEETHRFLINLNDRKNHNRKFVKKETKKAMTKEELEKRAFNKSLRKTLKKRNKEIISYFNF